MIGEVPAVAQAAASNAPDCIKSRRERDDLIIENSWKDSVRLHPGG
jgi:hypothetical protein